MYCSLPGDGYRGSCADNPELSNVPSINEARSSSKHIALPASPIARNSAVFRKLHMSQEILLFCCCCCKRHVLPEILLFFCCFVASFTYCQKFCLILQASSIARNSALFCKLHLLPEIPPFQFLLFRLTQLRFSPKSPSDIE